PPKPSFCRPFSPPKLTANQKCHAARIPLKRLVMLKLQWVTFSGNKINSTLIYKQKPKRRKPK
ncbi:hypothetical protein ACWOGZ_004309, partial [Vibrio vulnificus]